MNAVDIANAALLEVGRKPSVFEAPDRAVPGRISMQTYDRHPLARRAVWLARLASSGPDYIVRCDRCFQGGRGVPCTPVRDALRGATCGGES